MSVPVDVSFDNYVGTGAQVNFNTTFPFEKASDLLVTVAGVTKVLNTDYTVTGGSFGTGTVVFGVAPANGAAVHIERDVDFVQPIAFRTQGPFSPDAYERGMDRLTYQTQELERRVIAIESGTNTNPAVAGNGLQNVAGTWKVKPGGVGQVGAYAGGAGPAWWSTPTGCSWPGATAKRRRSAATPPPARTAPRATLRGRTTSTTRSDRRRRHRVCRRRPAPRRFERSLEGRSPARLPRAWRSRQRHQGGRAGRCLDEAAREDHKHDVTTAPAVDLTDAASTEGVATTLTRSDHTHAHGNRGGGPLHAEVTTVADGFMIASDKAKLDAITEFANTLVQTVSSSVTTVDATATPVGVLATAINGEGYYVDAIVIALKTDASQAAAYRLQAIYRKAAGTLTLVGAVQQVFVQEDDAAWDATLIISGGNVRAQVTGKAATNITWKIYSRAYQCP
jgi:hypothetical protein